MAKPRILLIEDDDAIRQVLKLQLEAAGYEPLSAVDGDEGIAKARAEAPDLIITDLMMPGFDGHEVVRRLRSHFRTDHIPVIMLTARGDQVTRLNTLDLGANDYLAKPYDRQELLLRVRNLLAWSEAQREVNPLTGLPGNVSIEREIRNRLSHHNPFVFLYIDIDNFKAYNDYYGYRQGDEAIRLTARLIVETAMKHGSADDFIGHVGGDDFVMVIRPESLEQVTADLIRRFDTESRALFNETDRQAGFIRVLNRRGEMESFALMSLTIAAVPSARYEIEHVAQLNDLATELKKYGKSIRGSVVVLERRGDEAAGLTGTED